MKKIISILLIMIVGMSGAVFAEDFQINKGWNLVPILYLNVENINFKETSFLFDPFDKSYFSVQEFEANTNKYGLKSEFAATVEKRFSDYDYWKLSYPVWYYSNSDITISSNTISEYNTVTKDKSIYLVPGWNLVTINELMLNTDMNNLFDESCGLEKIYFYNPEKQNWIKVPLYDEFNEKELGHGIAIKTSNNCELNSNDEISAPPSIPTSSEETPTEEETKEFGLLIIEDILNNDCDSFADKIYFKNSRDYGSKEEFLEKDSLGKQNGLCKLKEELVEGEISLEQVKSDKRYRAEDLAQLRTMGSLIENYGVDNSNLYGFIINGVEESEDYSNYELKPQYFLFKKINNEIKIVYFEN